MAWYCKPIPNHPKLWMLPPRLLPLSPSLLANIDRYRIEAKEEIEEQQSFITCNIDQYRIEAVEEIEEQQSKKSRKKYQFKSQEEPKQKIEVEPLPLIDIRYWSR
ncbi:hypothetical protein Dimus_033973 [Dionaea muscipula]